MQYPPSVVSGCDDSSDLREEVSRLKSLLESERRYRLQLEDDNRDLLSQICILNERITRLEGIDYIQRGVPSGEYHDECHRQDNLCGSDTVEAIVVPSYRDDRLKLCIPNACNGSNVIACLIFVDPLGIDADLLLCCGSNSSVHAYDCITGVHIFSHSISAPVIALASFDSYVACGLMDGQLSVLRIIDGAIDKGSELTCRSHVKVITCLQWSADGTYLVTSSYDKMVVIHSVTTNSSSFGIEICIKHSLLMDNVPESMALVPIEGSSSKCDDDLNRVEAIKAVVEYQLIIGQRDSCFLSYYNCSDLTLRLVSLNESPTDLHASLTPLLLVPSPDGRYLLIATDKSMHIIMKMGTNTRISVLSGHNCSAYGKPIACWDVEGDFVYSNSEHENTIVVYCVCTGKVVKILEGHSGIVRTIHRHPCKHALLSGSYDKSAILWSR